MLLYVATCYKLSASIPRDRDHVRRKRVHGPEITFDKASERGPCTLVQEDGPAVGVGAYPVGVIDAEFLHRTLDSGREVVHTGELVQEPAGRLPLLNLLLVELPPRRVHGDVNLLAVDAALLQEVPLDGTGTIRLVQPVGIT